MKRQISLFLCFVMCICITISPVSAVARDTSLEESYAVSLKQLGLFKGVSDTDFDLERAPTRVEALVMLIRVLGKEQEALEGTWQHPFDDVPAWANAYVGYAYTNGLTNGVSATKFGSGDATAATYLTFVLRALGYSDTNGADFTWNDPYTLAKDVGILTDSVNIDNFWRADIATISYLALSTKLKNSADTLSDKLISANVFTVEQYGTVMKPEPEGTRYYAEMPDIPDFGWYSGISNPSYNLSNETHRYKYNWKVYYSKEDFDNLLSRYFDLLKEEGYTYMSEGKTAAGNIMYSFLGRGYSINCLVYDRHMTIELKNTTAMPQTTAYFTLKDHVISNGTYDTNRSTYTISVVNADGVYGIYYLPEKKLMTLGGGIFGSNEQLTINIMLSDSGYNYIVLAYDPLSLSVEYNAAIELSKFSKTVSLTPINYTGAANQEKKFHDIAVNQAITALKKCQEYFLKDLGITLSDLGFTALD